MVEKIAARLPAQDEVSLKPGGTSRRRRRRRGRGDRHGPGRIRRYQRLTDHYGLRVVGVDYDGPRVERLAAEGLRVIEGDATDLYFWHQLRRSDSVRIAVLAMPRHGANVTALDCLRESGFSGKVAAVARYDDEVQWAKDHGVDIAFNVYAGAGLELADQVGNDPERHSVEPEAGTVGADSTTRLDNDSPEAVGVEPAGDGPTGWPPAKSQQPR